MVEAKSNVVIARKPPLAVYVSTDRVTRLFRNAFEHDFYSEHTLQNSSSHKYWRMHLNQMLCRAEHEFGPINCHSTMRWR